MDRAEIETLYRRYGTGVLRRARAILGDEALAFDAMQDVFMGLVTGETEFRRASSPLTFLYQVTTNRCLNLMRNALNQKRLLAVKEPAEATADSPESAVAVAQLLRALPEELREIAIYYYVDQMDQQEIATLTGVSRRTIGNRLEEFRARARAASGVAP